MKTVLIYLRLVSHRQFLLSVKNSQVTHELLLLPLQSYKIILVILLYQINLILLLWIYPPHPRPLPREGRNIFPIFFAFGKKDGKPFPGFDTMKVLAWKKGDTYFSLLFLNESAFLETRRIKLIWYKVSIECKMVLFLPPLSKKIHIQKPPSKEGWGFCCRTNST